MHILTGLIVAGLAGKMKRNKALGGLPRFRTGPLRVAHAIPGRIRFVVPALRSADPSHAALLDPLETLPGVKSLKVNTVSGSIVLEYRPNQLSPPQLFGAISKLLGLEAELEKTPTPAMIRELKELGKSVNRAVYEETNGIVDLWTMAILALIVIGSKKMFERGGTALPAGFTLLWWALNSLTRRGGSAE